MTRFTNNFANFTARSRLYRVWVPLHDDGRAPLISIWIDPTMAAFERQEDHPEIALSSVSDSPIAEEIEDSIYEAWVVPRSDRLVAEAVR
jgi:hypothetical protein